MDVETGSFWFSGRKTDTVDELFLKVRCEIVLGSEKYDASL